MRQRPQQPPIQPNRLPAGPAPAAPTVARGATTDRATPRGASTDRAPALARLAVNLLLLLRLSLAHAKEPTTAKTVCKEDLQTDSAIGCPQLQKLSSAPARKPCIFSGETNQTRPTWPGQELTERF